MPSRRARERQALNNSNNSTKRHKRVVPFNESLIEKPKTLPPPCPGSAHPCKDKMCYKAQTRQYKCSMPGVRPASASEPVPLIFSLELMQRQRVFRNENPFETSKFGRFEAQLPRTSNLSRVLREGLCASGDGQSECDTCAVVGASGSLLARRHGALIDAHEVVLRPNWLLTKGYETVVGTRTDLNVFFGVEGMVDQFLQARRKLPASLRPIGLITPASDKSVASIMRHMGRERERNRSSTDIFLLSDSVYHRALGSLCAATQQGCDWPRGNSKMRPSTGFFTVVVALQLCRKVIGALFAALPNQACGPPTRPCY
jgi:hypothetical protein